MVIKRNKYALYRWINIVLMKAFLVFLIVAKSENFIRRFCLRDMQ